ncbi:transmembrane protein, putative (macronuclear) [Tetrahymena thermophila SB210]|uniref:Transmembrane protein, putative n=1 Tax=Tetrahymena thermophila (strain SB210) TaxID=312017 RepID=W7XKU3_TETTS|nr:transmembrane protein, putative [Tetrahymena thermophila SB210]EWS75229.1 transmembrane protein, putative [Tetrahymena thermophila SB210]|eukprot:XP_012652220.1 transmembrane protein, putative [Tetrahymena thermophila SB210]
MNLKQYNLLFYIFCLCFFFLLIQLIFLFSFCFQYQVIHFFLFNIFSSFFDSNKLTTYFSLQYIKRCNQIDDKGVIGLCFGLGKCINLSNLKLKLEQKKTFNYFVLDCYSFQQKKQIQNKITYSFNLFIRFLFYQFFFFFCLLVLSFIFNLTLFFIFNFFFYCQLIFLLFNIFYSSQIISYILFLQNLKSQNQIGDEGTLGLGSSLTNCSNLSNLAIDLAQKYYLF